MAFFTTCGVGLAFSLAPTTGSDGHGTTAAYGLKNY